MKHRTKILGSLFAGVFTAAAALLGAGPAQAADPNTCFIRTATNNYVTAVGGGGRTTDVMHTNATVASTWERFTLVNTGDNSHYGLRTAFGYYVTAVASGGLSSGTYPDVLHTDATVLRDWEKFTFVSDGAGRFGIRAFDGHLLGAVGGGGRTYAAFDSNRTTLGTTEKFLFTCNV
ncbi:hypothetical protein BJ973_000724 [Actinoplanes tereljensis]|uniref:Uncharacterized protein n=1 Tax=Paractinoplanes tereljensis TaxID=571912 RepID=A0A919NRD1_9ACTN|nr:hypothetical protein [Actinoplanes tereljensis]GIF22918.1 hypothetical protein Ate02nite_56480 [Actinoplanes tereljensis]